MIDLRQIHSRCRCDSAYSLVAVKRYQPDQIVGAAAAAAVFAPSLQPSVGLSTWRQHRQHRKHPILEFHNLPRLPRPPRCPPLQSAIVPPVVPSTAAVFSSSSFDHPPATMPPPKCPAITAAQDVARPFFDVEKESYPTRDHPTFTAAYGGRQVYGPKKKKGKELIKLIIKDKAVRRAYGKAKGSKSKGRKLSKEIEQWLTKPSLWRLVVEAGRGFIKVLNRSGSTIALGEVTINGQKYAKGNALAAAQEEKGLYQYFVLFEEGTEACGTVSRAAMGEVVSDIHNVLGSFDIGRPLEIAKEQVTHLLELLAAESECSVADVLGGYTLDEIHGMSFEELEEIAMARGREWAKEHGLDLIDAKHNGVLRFQTLANKKIYIDDVVSDLENRKCAAVPCQDGFGPYSFPAAFEGRITIQNCHGGGTSRHGYDPKEEYERDWITEDGRYVVDKYGASGFIIDMKAEINSDNNADINMKVPIPGEDANSFARILNVENPHENYGLTTFQVELSQGGDNGAITRVHHQILQQVQSSSGSGMKNHAEFNEYLGGKTFEEKYPFTPRDERRYNRLLEEWQEKYPGIDFASWCDVDHCVGRSKRWMNNVLFTNLCSHRWNSCMAAVRIRAGDWCFGLGTKVYGSGND